ncbi:hypothetical protein GDO78_018973, partial [Eleutherodactylus coqui]
GQPDNVLGQQYEYQIRPCIDLIDSLRSLGVEKDLALPAIAVIGDQSSGKSSVLEALSGVNLPRGSGKIKYRDQEVVLKSPGQVEKEVRKAQDFMAGAGNGVSDELITLAVESPNVPDLTLLDLPGITRVALANQPQDIGQQIKRMIKTYIQRQETINLAVVPSNVDIATTEALEMAREVDPNGERTLGILTKPDLVDKGSEADIVSVVRNLVYTLKKGFMVVKCRGQSEIQNNISLENALLNEKDFFENHEHFRTIPTLEKQIITKLNEAETKLKIIGAGVPAKESDKLCFLIEKIRHFVDGINEVMHGDEEVSGRNLKLFTNIRKRFNVWEMKMKESVDNFPKQLKDDISVYENQHRGRELPGFVNYKTFENIAKSQIKKFEEPAIAKLHEITELVRSTFNKIAMNHFFPYPNLYRCTKGNLEVICSKQQKEAENFIRTQFQMEEIIYCQDTIYGASLKVVREDVEPPPLKIFKPSPAQISVDEMSQHIQAYFKNASARLLNQIPMIILHYMLHQFADKLQTDIMLLLQDKERLSTLLMEKNDLVSERQNLKDRIKRLRGAQQRLAKFPG